MCSGGGNRRFVFIKRMEGHFEAGGRQYAALRENQAWCGKNVLNLSVLASLMSHMRKCSPCVKNGQRTAGVISNALKNTQLPHTPLWNDTTWTLLHICKSGNSLNGLRHGKKEFFLGCKSDGTYDVPHLTCQPINQLHS